MEYVGVLLFLVVGALFVSLTLVASSLVRPSKITREKVMPYECGENPVGNPWGVRFNIRFYVFALVFLVFDVEAVMLIPWAVAFKSMPAAAFGAGMIFIAMLALGLADVWRKGDLEWVRGEDRAAAKAKGAAATIKAA
ncbi:MAG: NADH-quinone oxidoreductase subunit A [Vicinamibacteria bacterium]